MTVLLGRINQSHSPQSGLNASRSLCSTHKAARRPSLPRQSPGLCHLPAVVRHECPTGIPRRARHHESLWGWGWRVSRSSSFLGAQKQRFGGSMMQTRSKGPLRYLTTKLGPENWVRAEDREPFAKCARSPHCSGGGWRCPLGTGLGPAAAKSLGLESQLLL